MITLLQRNSMAGSKLVNARPVAKPAFKTSGRKADFHNLLQPLAASPAATLVARSNATNGAAKLANSSAGAVARPAADDSGTPASTPIPIPPITDVHDKNQVEAHMNAWLENVTQHANDQKTQIYQQAMKDWQANCDRCQALGLQPPPQPTPPALDPVQPMPSGWWFLT